MRRIIAIIVLCALTVIAIVQAIDLAVSIISADCPLHEKIIAGVMILVFGYLFFGMFQLIRDIIKPHSNSKRAV